MKNLFLLLGIVALTHAFVARAESSETSPAAAAPAVESPKEAPKKTYTGTEAELKSKMEALFDASKNINGAGKAKARAHIEGAMAWDKIAEVCLGPTEWKKQSAANKSKFKNLLKDVIIKTAYSRLDTFWDNTTYEFTEISAKGNEGVVKCDFNAKDESVSLHYYFGKVGGKWLITDIAYEDIRYSVTIGEQVATFLKEKSFPGLIDKLQKRLQELEKPSSKKA